MLKAIPAVLGRIATTVVGFLAGREAIAVIPKFLRDIACIAVPPIAMATPNIGSLTVINVSIKSAYH